MMDKKYYLIAYAISLVLSSFADTLRGGFLIFVVVMICAYLVDVQNNRDQDE